MQLEFLGDGVVCCDRAICVDWVKEDNRCADCPIGELLEYAKSHKS